MADQPSKRSRLRPVFLEGEDGVTFIPVPIRSQQRTQRIFDVQYRFIEGKATETDLAQIAGQKVAGKTVETDPKRLERIADAGDADLIEAYREQFG
jgi:hypothetical protein